MHALLVTLALAVAAATPSCSGVAEPQSATGIRGVVLRSPVDGGPVAEDEPSEEPFSALFHVTGEGGESIASFQSDAEGRFEVFLAPGSYTIVPDASAPILRAELQKKPVTVPAGVMVEVTLHFDTGLR